MPGDAGDSQSDQGKIKSPSKLIHVEDHISAIARWVGEGDFMQIYNLCDPMGVEQFTQPGSLDAERKTRRENLKASLGISLDADLSSLNLAEFVSQYKAKLAAALPKAEYQRNFRQSLAETYLTQLLSVEKISCLLSESRSKEEIEHCTTNLYDASINPLIRVGIALVIHKNLTYGAAILKTYLMSCSVYVAADYTEYADTYLKAYLSAGVSLDFLMKTIGIPGIPKDRRETAYNNVLKIKRFHIDAENPQFKELSQLSVFNKCVNLVSSASVVESAAVMEVDVLTTSRTHTPEKRKAGYEEDENDADVLKKAKFDAGGVAILERQVETLSEQLQARSADLKEERTKVQRCQEVINKGANVSAELSGKLSALRENVVMFSARLDSQQAQIVDLEQQVREAEKEKAKLFLELEKAKIACEQYRQSSQAGMIGRQGVKDGSADFSLPFGFGPSFGFPPAALSVQPAPLLSPPFVPFPPAIPPGLQGWPPVWSPGMYAPRLPQQFHPQDLRVFPAQEPRGPGYT